MVLLFLRDLEPGVQWDAVVAAGHCGPLSGANLAVSPAVATFSQMLRAGFKGLIRLWNAVQMVSSRARASLAAWTQRADDGRDRDRRWAILQAQAKSYVLKLLLWHRPRDDVAGATGPDPSWYTGSKLSETALLNDDNGTGSIWRVDDGMGSRRSPVGATTRVRRKW